MSKHSPTLDSRDFFTWRRDNIYRWGTEVSEVEYLIIEILGHTKQESSFKQSIRRKTVVIPASWYARPRGVHLPSICPRNRPDGQHFLHCHIGALDDTRLVHERTDFCPSQGHQGKSR